jgi:hypothetical protein
MSAFQVTMIYCDQSGCDQRIGLDIPGVVLTRTHAKQQGWVYVTHSGHVSPGDYCPVHAVDPDDRGAC